MAEPSAEAQKSPDEKTSATGGEDLSLVLDVPVQIRVLLGEAVLTIGEILKCGKGSVIPLNQKVGSPFTVTLQKKPIAEGEIVQAGENFGIKITQILKEGGETNEKNIH